MNTERQEQGSQTHNGAKDQQAVLELELRRLTAVERIIRLAFYALGCLGLGYIAYLVATSLAGLETSVNVTFHLFKSSDVIPWLAALIAFVWAFFEHWMRRRQKLAAERGIDFMQSARNKYESARTLNRGPQQSTG